MQFIRSLYRRFLVFSSVMIALPVVLTLVPAPSVATTTSSPVQTSASETTRKLGPEDCRLDQHAYAPNCTMQGRTVRVIGF